MAKEIKTMTLKVSEIGTKFGNPRKISKKEKEKLKESLQVHGDFGLFLVNENKDIIAGNQRLSILREINPEMRNDAAFKQEYDALSLTNVSQNIEDIFPDYVFDPHTLKGKKMGRNFKNYDFDYIESKDMKPKCKQASMFDGQEWTYDDMYDKDGNKTYPDYEIQLKKFGET